MLESIKLYGWILYSVAGTVCQRLEPAHGGDRCNFENPELTICSGETLSPLNTEAKMGKQSGCG